MPIDDELRNQILSSIELEGASSEENKAHNLVIVNRNSLSTIIDFASGLPRIRNSASPRFSLILNQPQHLAILSPLAIRCCLCSKVISYPAWYYDTRFAVNWFNYFVCFNPLSPSKVTAKCFKRI